MLNFILDMNVFCSFRMMGWRGVLITGIRNAAKLCFVFY